MKYNRIYISAGTVPCDTPPGGHRSLRFCCLNLNLILCGESGTQPRIMYQCRKNAQCLRIRLKILSAEGRSVRLLTARLKWCCTEQSKGAADIIGIKPAGSYLLGQSVRKWMAFFSAQDESCQHPAQKIITAGRKAYSVL